MKNGQLEVLNKMVEFIIFLDMNSGIEDLAKKYGLIKHDTYYYRWDVSGISTMGYVLKVVGNIVMMAGNIYVESNWAYPHIEHNLWLEVEFCDIEDRLIELKKQWEKAVIEMKEYKMKEKMEKIDRDFLKNDNCRP